VEAAADTAAAALAEEVTWAVSAEVIWVASAEHAWEVLGEVTMALATAEVTMAMAMAEVTMAMEDTMGMAMEDVITVTAITALIARITRHTDGRTPAPTEWCVDSEVARARLLRS
jgi:hypothetical protein